MVQTSSTQVQATPVALRPVPLPAPVPVPARAQAGDVVHPLGPAAANPAPVNQGTGARPLPSVRIAPRLEAVGTQCVRFGQYF